MPPSSINPLTGTGWGLFLGLLIWLGWLAWVGASLAWRLPVGLLALGVAVEAWRVCRER